MNISGPEKALSAVASSAGVPDTAHEPCPIPVGDPTPHRKVIRSWIIPLSKRKTTRALALTTSDILVFLLLITGTVYFSNVWIKLGLSLAAGFYIGRIFILGHDACHMSFTPHKKLNKWLGRIAFLPSLTPYSLWEVGHNVVHHGQTNLKGFDFVWAPFNKAEYDAMSPVRKALERIYRSGFGPAVYYFIEMWWNRMFFPNRKNMPTRRPEFLWDNILVSVFALLWIFALTVSAIYTGQSVLLCIATGFVIPFIFWNAMIGFVVYVHHTHPGVTWYDNKNEWLRAQPFVSTTVHLTFPMGWGRWMHHIMEHTAHHVDMGIPLYKLKQAQSKLEEMLPGRIIVQRFSWHWYFHTARLCKLYDTHKKCWMDFKGNTTAQSTPVVLTPVG